MPITFSCPRCSKTLRAPDAAAGKSSPCPGCGALATCPEPVYEAEVVLVSPKKTPPAKSPPQQSHPKKSPPAVAPPKKPPPVNPYADLDDDKPYALVNPPAPAAAERSAEIRRPCPACGERILSEAAVCRFCGEVFDATLKKGKVKKPKKSFSQTSAADGRDLVVGFLCFAIGTGLTVASYANAASQPGGGRYMVCYGLILGGLVGMFRGMSGLARSGR